MILEMRRVEIIGLKPSLNHAVQTLQSLGCMHIDEIEFSSDPGIRKLVVDEQTLREQEEPGYLLAQVEGQLEIMGGPSDSILAQSVLPDLVYQVRTGLEQLSPIVQKLTSRQSELKSELDLLPRYETVLRRLLPILPESARVEGNVSTGIFVSRAYSDLLDMISREMFKIAAGHGDVVTLDIDEETRAMLLVFPAEFSPAINAFLGQQDVSRLRLPGDIGEAALDATLVKIQRRVQAIPELLEVINREINGLRGQWCDKLTFWQQTLADRLAAFRILSAFGETEKTFVVVGWIPAPDLEKVRESLLHEVGETVLLHELPITPELKERVPIVLQNPPVARSFEGLVRLRALPHYGEIDPSGLMAIFMPIFFGLMLGDIGYGIVLLLLTLWLMRRFKDGMLHDLLMILAVGSGWSIAFGAAFGEIFGTLGEDIGLHPLLFDRADPDHLVSLLALTIGIGGAHLTLGLILGLWEAWNSRSRSHLMERGGMLLGLIAMFLIAGVMVELLPEALLTPAAAVLIVGVVLLSTPMGWLGILMGPLEFIGLIGNVLSYLRIAAIGLASVYLALVANEIAGLVGSIVVGIVIAALIHALNIALGAFSPSIQSLRLHYVEFFRKFYEGGGRAYEPFRRRLV